jgi:inner membrane protein
MVWWLWVLVGLALLVVELVTPGGLFALFFGFGALAVAVLAVIGVGPIAQWLAFTAISLLLLATLRRALQDKLQARRAPVDSLVGEEAVLLEDLAAGGEAKAELRGVPWSARAAPGVALRAGQRCRVERVDGLVLWIRAD